MSLAVQQPAAGALAAIERARIEADIKQQDQDIVDLNLKINAELAATEADAKAAAPQQQQQRDKAAALRKEIADLDARIATLTAQRNGLK